MQIRIRTEVAIDYFGGKGRGGVQRLAQALRITHGAVSQWGEYVPEGQAYKLFVITSYAIAVESDLPPIAA